MPRAFDGSSASALRSLGIAVGLLAILAAFAAMVFASPAHGAYAHTTITGEYGKDGANESNGGAQHLAWDEALDRLYFMSGSQMNALHVSAPGTAAPVGSPFPVTTGIFAGSGDPHFTVDNSGEPSAGNFYLVAGSGLKGYSSAGTELGGEWPISSPGETCGLAVTSEGELWGGHYGGGNILKWNAAGEQIGEIDFEGQPCKIAIDKTTDDLYAQNWSGGTIYKFSASNGYSTQTFWRGGLPNNVTFSVNGQENRLYIVQSNEVRAYDLDAATLVETVPLGTGSTGVVVDEPTDTLFVTSWQKGKILEIPGALVPTATTGDPTGNKTVSGTANPDGAGDIETCVFEYGLLSGSGYTDSVPCDQSLPITSSTPVTATLNVSETEVTYRYRLKVCNAEPGGCHFGAQKTITPHAVEGLATGNATGITRNEATLHASFEGNTEETDVWFEYGLTTSYGQESSIENFPSPSGLTNVAIEIEGLEAGKTYHYRAVGENGEGLSRSVDMTFTTAPAVKDISTNPPTDIDTEKATLHGSLDPDNFETTYYFQWGKDTTYGYELPLAPGEDVGTTAPGTTNVSEVLDNLEPGTTYHYRLVAINEEGTTFGGDQSFTTRAAPSILSFSSDNVAEDSAELIATINPNGYDTTAYFEYGTSPQYGQIAVVPQEQIETGTTPQDVRVKIDNLIGVTYHFRLRAENQWGEVITPNQTFDFNPPTTCPNHTIRQQTGAAYLPDCRAYELVSPGRSGGAAIFPDGPKSAYATNPARFPYIAAGNAMPGTGEPPNGGVTGDFYVATRSNTGWTTKYVGVPGYEAINQGGAPGDEYGTFNNGILATKDLNRFLVWDRKHYTGFINGPLAGSYSPFVYDNEGNRITRLPTNVYEVEDALLDMNEGGYRGSVRITPDLSHYVFSSIFTAFKEGGQTAAPGTVYDNDVETGELTIASLMPDNVSPIPQDALGGTGTEFIRIPGLSEDGTHILMSTQAPGNTTHLYLRVDHAVTYEISADHTGVNRGVKFEGMTPDGSTIYITTNHKMTEDDADTSIDLYRWREETGELELVAVAPGKGNTNACTPANGWIGQCGVQVVPTNTYFPGSGEGQPAAPIDNALASETGEIYFYSPEILDGAWGFPNKRNLYVATRDGSVEYVATMEGNRPISRINVTPDGTHAAFITASKLTSYDNGSWEEMYTFDKQRDEIVCVSCIPDGSPPSAHVEGSKNGLFLTHDGRAFFSTRDALVDRDANGIIDVYEFADSRPQLVSTGTGDKEGRTAWPPNSVGLIGVSANGIDAYFATYDTLVPQDENGPLMKIYDARTNGGFSYEEPPAPCEAADECHGPDSNAPAPLQIGTSAALGDGGNVRSKPKRCVKRKKAAGKKRRAAKRRSASASAKRNTAKKRKKNRCIRPAKKRRGGRNG